MENKTECECPIAMYCKRHNMQKSAHFHKLCQNHPGYFRMWEECRGPGQNPNDCTKEEPIKEEVKAVEKIEPELPSMFSMAKNFVAAATTHIITGAANVTDEVREARLNICKECPLYIASEGRCSKCGCYLESKTKWASSTCPIGRW